MSAPRILLIDDNEDELRIYSTVLGHYGCEIVEARTAREGGALARRLRPALILLDVRLPDGSGLELARDLKQDGDTAGIPIVAMSLFDPPMEAVVAAGCDGYLSKPFEPARLVREVSRFTGLSRAEGPAATRHPAAEPGSPDVGPAQS